MNTIIPTNSPRCYPPLPTLRAFLPLPKQPFRPTNLLLTPPPSSSLLSYLVIFLTPPPLLFCPPRLPPRLSPISQAPLPPLEPLSAMTDSPSPPEVAAPKESLRPAGELRSKRGGGAAAAAPGPTWRRHHDCPTQYDAAKWEPKADGSSWVWKHVVVSKGENPPSQYKCLRCPQVWFTLVGMLYAVPCYCSMRLRGKEGTRVSHYHPFPRAFLPCSLPPSCPRSFSSVPEGQSPQ